MRHSSDPRDLRNGLPVPSLAYCDQVYLVRTDDGAWLAVMTTGAGREGDRGQHIAALRSADRGVSWSEPVPIEPVDGPEASYAVLLKAVSGRIYAFYNHNTDNVREVIREDGKTFSRVDSLGHYVFKYSDDHGRTWSARRYRVPVRLFAVDRENVYQGRTLLFWNVGRPFVEGSTVFLPHIKVAAMGEGFFAQSEGAILRSDNLLRESDPKKIRFDTLPEGETGLRTPVGGGRIAEEQSIVVLSDGSLYCVYRSIDGWPVCSYSRDGGTNWTPPAYKCFQPGGKRMKHPRAANFVWKCSNGKYLYWFHNHGGGSRARGHWDPYNDRNPAWLSCGTEQDSPEGRVLVWSQPEILLYDDDPLIRMSYPDLIEENGRFYVTETQKAMARIHPIEETLLQGLFNQETRTALAGEPVWDSLGSPSEDSSLPELPWFCHGDPTREERPSFFTRRGLSIELTFQYPSRGSRTILLSTLSPNRRGFCLSVEADGNLEILLTDGRSECRWSSIRTDFPPGNHHAVIILDSGPRVIVFLLDGVLDDGGEESQFGWGRLPPHLTHINGDRILFRHSQWVQRVRLFDRALRTSEAVASARAFLGDEAGA